MSAVNFDILIQSLMLKCIEGKANAEELKELQEWLDQNAENRVYFDQLQEIVQNTNENEFAEFNSVTAFKNIDLKKPKVDEPVISATKLFVPNKVTSNFIFKVAAGALILVGVTAAIVLYNLQFANIKSNDNIAKIIDFPDGSTCTMNINSAIKYKKNFENRNIELDGEAFFEVKHLSNQKFVVTTKYATITVLGTKFNVKACLNDSFVAVSVAQGRVEVKNNKGEHTIITKNEAAFVNIYDDKITTQTNDAFDPNLLSWKTHKISFRNSSFVYVIKILEQQYHVKFNVANKLHYNLKLTTDFENKTLDEVLKVLQLTFQVETIRKDALVYIK